MKAIGGFGLLIFLVVTVYWLSASSGGQDATVPIQIAFGNPRSAGIDMHVVIGVVMANRDRIRKDGSTPTWDEWVADHFELKDAANNVLKLERKNNSSLIQQLEVIGTQEFFLVTTLRAGQSYVFDYIPDVTKPGRYRCPFTAPTSGAKVRMIDLQKVK
jgi:hypothetical protein